MALVSQPQTGADGQPVPMGLVEDLPEVVRAPGADRVPAGGSQPVEVGLSTGSTNDVRSAVADEPVETVLLDDDGRGRLGRILVRMPHLQSAQFMVQLP